MASISDVMVLRLLVPPWTGVATGVEGGGQEVLLVLTDQDGTVDLAADRQAGDQRDAAIQHHGGVRTGADVVVAFAQVGGRTGELSIVIAQTQARLRVGPSPPGAAAVRRWA